jgi:hypothetical protein
VRTGLRSQRWFVAVFALASAITVGACSTHRVAVTNPCPTLTKNGVVVVSPNRGAIGLAKIGLTPAAVKAQEKCA